jgi:hypothetical protein
MRMRLAKTLLLAVVISVAAAIPAGLAQSGNAASTYDSKFFQTLKKVFDNFSDVDLQRAFQSAQPITCSELIGNWRQAAFFNEDRNLERWYFKSFEEVQAELSRYVFQGRCNTESATLELTTRFPIRESVDAYNKSQIEFDRIAFKINAPVKASFDDKLKSYTFDLPYLYPAARKDTYSLLPQNASATLSTEVTNLWECKAVKAADVTYRFVLCKASVTKRNVSVRNASENKIGKSAYVLLTDGREARSTVTLRLENSTQENRSIAKTAKVIDLSRRDFILRFPSASWDTRIESTATLSGGQFQAGKDYCEWKPQSPATLLLTNDADRTHKFYLSIGDITGPGLVTIESRTAGEVRLGTLRCFFPSQSIVDVDLNGLSAVTGEHLGVELR